MGIVTVLTIEVNVAIALLDMFSLRLFMKAVSHNGLMGTTGH